MAIWIESHIELAEHPKVYDLSAALGVTLAETVGLLHLLWHFTMRFAWRDGDLSKFTHIAIARGSKWENDPNKFIKSLQDSRWLDKLKVHDWQSFAGRLIRDRLYKEGINVLQKNAKSTPRGAKRTPKCVTKPLPNQPTLTNTNLQTKDLAANDAPLPPHTLFVQMFKESYEAMTSQPFKAGPAQYSIAAALIKAHGFEACSAKVKILGALCRDRTAWFTLKEGWAAFTLETLSNKWNNILPKEGKEAEFLRELKKAGEKRDRTDALIETKRPV